MTHRTGPTSTAAELERAPLDLDTMRANARRLLAPDAQPIAPERLDTLVQTLRGHIELMIPEVEAACLGLPNDDVPKACALAGVREARMRLRLGMGDDNEPVRMSVAMKLARSVNGLCDHHENLTNGRT